jgi:hypothetical protein
VNVKTWKARLVALGFMGKEGVDYNPFSLYAPTMLAKTARTVITLGLGDNAHLHSYDVSAAFLHANLREVVYIEQPAGFVVPGK